MKRVLFVVIDALASRIVRPALESGQLPYLDALARAGWVNWNNTAIFPSITPAATAALITGEYPTQTGIAGAYYYDTERDLVHYYGDDFWMVLRQGFGHFFEDFLVNLNDRQLRAPTLYQVVEQAGGRAACLNYLWFHGDHEHTVHVPWLLRFWPTVPFSKSVHGPEWLALGDFVKPRVGARRKRLRGKGGLRYRFGISDRTTSQYLLKLAKYGPLPELTVAYFPNNDFKSHREGPQQALSCVKAVNETLGMLMESAGGVDAFLRDTNVVITGDHSQSDLPYDQARTGIVVNELLHGFQQADAGRPWSSGDEVMACPNMRAAQLYLRPNAWPRRYELVDNLLRDERVDQVFWFENGTGDHARYFAATRDRGRLEFWPESGSGAQAHDEYGGGWTWNGDLATVDGRVDDEGTLRFGDYPNAFERIVTGFNERVSGDVWMTSRVGYEFRLSIASNNAAGSHGSLHALDSLSPLFVAGPDVPSWPQTPRSVDIAPLCARMLGLPSNRPLGASHVTAERVARI